MLKSKWFHCIFLMHVSSLFNFIKLRLCVNFIIKPLVGTRRFCGP